MLDSCSYIRIELVTDMEIELKEGTKGSTEFDSPNLKSENETGI
jgi:hypothetical protein